MKGSLELSLLPEWERIQAAWDLCMEYLTGQGLDADAAYALCMVVQELLENAVKYGAFGPDRERIRLHLSVDHGGVIVEVQSPLDEDAEGVERLDTMIQWIRGFQSPFEAYVERLRDVARQSFAHGESGLGLVRMAYEGQCVLDFFTDDSNVLAMSAVYTPPGGQLGSSHGHA